jgi:RimJ/RimL family protein N-acetyltransferase
MQDEEVCRYLVGSPPRKVEETLALVREARELMARRQSIVFAQVWNETGRCVGSTRLLDVQPADRRVEIGATFLARPLWRTPANTESKYLFLCHCFEKLGCVGLLLHPRHGVAGGEAQPRRAPVRKSPRTLTP